jgi:hypothetical protein
LVDVVPQLLVPHPVVGLASLDDLVSEQLVNNIDVVDDIKDQRLNLHKQKVIATVFKGCVTFELPLEVSLVVLELALFNGIDAVGTEVHHLGQAAYLGWHVSNVQAIRASLALL